MRLHRHKWEYGHAYNVFRVEHGDPFMTTIVFFCNRCLIVKKKTVESQELFTLVANRR